MVFLGRTQIREGPKWRIGLIFKDGGRVFVKDVYVDATATEETIRALVETEIKRVLEDANKQSS